MNIAMFVNNLEVSGGYQKLVIRLAQNLERLGHSVVVYTPRLDLKNCYPKDINRIKVVSIKKQFSDITPVESYAHLLEKVMLPVDALIIHDELSLLGVAMLPEPLPKKIIWMLNNQLPEDLKKYKKEMASVYRQTIGTTKSKLLETKKAHRRVQLIRKGLQRINLFVTYDSFNKNLVKRILGRDAQIVYAGADLEEFRKYSKTRTFVEKRSYTVLSVGIVFPHRRYEDLIKAMAILIKQSKNVKAIIIGRQDLSPDYFKSLMALTTKLKLKKYIEFKNYVTGAEMIELYKDSDVFVFVNDGFTWGISVFEAVAAKLPVIITNNIGAVDLIKENQTGWVVSPRAPIEVAEAITEIIDNRELAEKIANKAYSDVTDIVSWEAYAKRMLTLIKDK
jgi:glycosyltransferase involved in cell wall biosynthesis